jgi:hypothetical protein
MAERRVDTTSRVPVPQAAAETAAELTRTVRDATRDLPFEIEPASFVVALEELADSDENRE